MPRCAICAQSTPVSATKPCTTRTASVPSTLLWKLPPQRLKASANACSVWSASASGRAPRRRRQRTPPTRRWGRSRRTATRSGSSATLDLGARGQRGDELAAAAAAGKLGRRQRRREQRRADVGPGRHRVAKISARHSVPLKRAAAAAGRRSPNTSVAACGAPPRSRNSARSAATPSSPAPASAGHTPPSTCAAARAARAATRRAPAACRRIRPTGFRRSWRSRQRAKSLRARNMILLRRQGGAADR